MLTRQSYFCWMRILQDCVLDPSSFFHLAEAIQCICMTRFSHKWRYQKRYTMQHLTAPVLPIHTLCWVVLFPVITVSIAVLFFFVANAVISFVSLSVKFYNTSRGTHTFRGWSRTHKNSCWRQKRIKFQHSRISSRGLLCQMQNV